jgi:Xaa-Pro aminopeptidase
MPVIERSPAVWVECLRRRRHALAEQFSHPVVLWSGQRPSRNFPANGYPFRANSHFLYFAGQPLEQAAIRLEQGRLELFLDDPSPASALWHGPTPSRDELAAAIAADAAYPYGAIAERMSDAATLPVQDRQTHQEQVERLGRSLSIKHHPHELDRALATAIVQLRLRHDDVALAEIRRAIQVSVRAHVAGMRATPTANTEADIRAAIERVILAADMTCAYNSIVTVHGEVLHNEVYHHAVQPGELVLADVGAETDTGWASDITRTWPVSGVFSKSQRDIYDVVLAAHDACIAAMRPGVEYRDLHLKAAAVLADGLIDLGILNGSVEAVVEQDAHALFFPHGIGHLLGLDVHDMEDLGDLAGYASGRQRSDRFGLGYLRLDRPLQPGMVVTIEPGFYQVPAILNDPERRSRYEGMVNWERLAQFSDVRGIRIEDDVLVTDDGHDVLTAELPTQAAAIEQLVAKP